MLVLDPKGDVTNLALTFPGLSADEFAPWVEGGDAAAVASSWTEGLAGWGLGPDQVRALHDGARVAIYTPGSEAGIPMNIVGSLQPPADTSDLEALRDEIQGYVSGVLGLVGVESDPISGREHVLLANLIERSWTAGESLDLATPVGMPATAPEPAVTTSGAPPAADGIPVAWLDPAAPWVPAIGLVPTGTTLSAAAVATIDLLYDDDTADLRHQETWEAILLPLVEGVDPASWIPVDHDDRDFKPTPATGVAYVETAAPITTKTFWSTLQKGLVEHLYRNRPLQVQRNKDLEVWSRAGETPEQFAVRCAEAADGGADAAAVQLTEKYAARIERARSALATAQNRAEDKQQEIADLEADLADDITAIAAEWDAKAAAVETVDIPLEKSDIAVRAIRLTWVPTA